MSYSAEVESGSGHGTAQKCPGQLRSKELEKRNQRKSFYNWPKTEVSPVSKKFVHISQFKDAAWLLGALSRMLGF